MISTFEEFEIHFIFLVCGIRPLFTNLHRQLFYLFAFGHAYTIDNIQWNSKMLTSFKLYLKKTNECSCSK